jgi:hypothetical protein
MLLPIHIFPLLIVAGNVPVFLNQFLLMIDDGYIKDLTNKFFETQLQHNDTIEEQLFPNHMIHFILFDNI